ncbi:MAG: hypothetical protein ACOX8D_05915 [Methanoculleus sp.]|jgi:hypothetical protein
MTRTPAAMSAHGISPPVGCCGPDGVLPGAVPVVASAGDAAAHVRAKRLKCETCAVTVRVAASTVAGLYHITFGVALPIFAPHMVIRMSGGSKVKANPISVIYNVIGLVFAVVGILGGDLITCIDRDLDRME